MITIGLSEIIGMGGFVSAVIIALWRVVVFFIKMNAESLKKCEEGHESLNNQMLDVREQLGEIKGHKKGVDAMIEMVRDELKQSLERM
jgi:hypothetical protein